ncbi:MAG: AAA family ATPase [Spirochaetaceae bacterium]|nr:MAG: AAA family ATPase [Spirochaetaceae bacterium]
MRPRTLDEFIGQDHIMGQGRLLRRAIQADMLSSLIFAGPPGTGKTTLAMVIANTTRSRFASLNAVLSGVKEVRAEIETAREQMTLHGRRTILFVDEVHRWNKAQQDALLPWVENGTVILIGATTENPFFEVNAALVSRSRIFQLRPLSADELRRVVEHALADPVRGYGSLRVRLAADALDHLIAVADGDARSLLNALQLAVETGTAQFPPPHGTEIRVSLEAAEESIQRKALLYDREGDYHYDTISAFIKSLRGSDPDAALYWMARMVAAGEDPRYILRRMLISAAEDVGMADPNALQVVEAAARAYDRVGLPEGQFHLAQAALYLATCPKSNSALGYFDARAAVEKERSRDVPRHLRDASRDRQGFGHGEGYLYPHAYRDHWVAQAYLPRQLQGRLFYSPSQQGYEARIATEVQRRRELQLALVAEDADDQEILTFSPPDSERERWLLRAAAARSAVLHDIRERVLAAAELRRHERVLVAGVGADVLVWEALRRTPEGLVAALANDRAHAERISSQASRLEALQRPLVCLAGPSRLLPAPDCAESELWPDRFEALLGRNLLQKQSDRIAALTEIRALCTPGSGRVVLAETVAHAGSRLSELFGHALSTGQRRLLAEAERAVYEDASNPMVNWDLSDVRHWFDRAGLEQAGHEQIAHTSRRTVPPAELQRWLLDESGRLGAALRSRSDETDLQQMAATMIRALPAEGVDWKTTVAVVWGVVRA